MRPFALTPFSLLPIMITANVLPNISTPALVDRTSYFCTIVNANANCRACPETDNTLCPVKTVLTLGLEYQFTCRIQGQAVQGD
jgi:hypothetical protein